MARIVLVELGGPCAEAIAVARALRDAGAEVIHAGVLHTPAAVAATVEQEDPGLVGLVPAPGTGRALADAVAAAVPETRVAVLDAGDDVVDWVKDGAICATDPSSGGCR
ncbi:hypothetical protein B0I33_113209 [Prauserella shujinwangii]|uniref:Methylmalonyl-CoA mutase C-terminal domain/subunit n=1 Tax=Prauserella shujinwangii TaxID=1453103 RepID=A0A2T0LLX9_9PSEU|nr:hypothetical protein B0I33_113209 [Prauserella shujinwangii]